MRHHTCSDQAEGVIGIPHTDDWQTQRLDAVTGNSTPRDPWCRKTFSPFYLSAQDLLDRAVRIKPQDPQPSPSSFAGWIYSLYSCDIHPHDLEKAKAAEEEILDARRDWTSYSEFRHFQLSDWRQIHCGLGAPSHNDIQKTFEIPDLQLNGVPLRAIPDLVFEHQDTGHIAIVEVKFSMAKVPSNLWPNVWAQLWAYSKIPEFASAPMLTCVGEVWGENARGWASEGLASSVYLRATVRRDPREIKFDRFFDRLFKVFTGQ